MKKVKENGMIKFSNVIEKQPSNLIAKNVIDYLI